MRKNLTGLTAAMAVTMAGTQFVQAAAPVWAQTVNTEVQSESSAEISDDAEESQTSVDEEYLADQEVGAYEAAESSEITDEIQTLCDKAFADLVGAVYTPVALIAKQVVAGTNYKILFEKEIVVPDAEKTYAIGIIYEDLEGNVSITEIDDISDEEAENLLAQAKSGNSVQTLVDTDNRIGSALTEKLAADKENVFISSYSIATALTLLSHCSESGEQIDQLKEFLGMDDRTEDEILAAQKALSEMLGANAQTDSEESTDENGYPKSILETANAVYIDDKLKTVSAFDDLTNIFSDTYQASLKKCDLSTEDTMNEINAWVNDKTHGLIDSILTEPMSESVRMTLFNAVYFKAAWIREFSEELTDKQTFHGAKGDTTVDMMHQQAHFDYAESDDYQMVRLPYYGNCEMTVYLPKDEATADKWSEEGYLSALVEDASDEEWSSHEISLSMPKFELEYGAELTDILQELGIEKIFNEQVYDRLSDEKLSVGFVYHKTAIKNDENGTEAAAVTMMIMEAMALQPEEAVVEMNMDHPFYFTISNTEAGLKLFEGCVYNLD